MLRRLPRVRLRPAHLAAWRLPFRTRHDQAHRRRTPTLPRAGLLLVVVVVTGAVSALQLGEDANATKSWTWSPLPATAFGSWPSDAQPTPGSDEGTADRPGPVASGESAPGESAPGESARTAPTARGGGSPTAPPLPSPSASPSPSADPALRETAAAAAEAAVSAEAPVGASVTVREGGQDAPSLAAVVRATPTPAPTLVPAPKGPTHVVASGDNLWTIARRHSADLGSILRWNEDVDADRLVAGQRILVPGGKKMQPLARPVPAPARTTPRTASVRPATNQQAAAPRVQNGDHLWPLPVRGTLTRRFSSAHPGIDIAAPQGTRVRAIADGTVVWAGWKNNGGGYVVEVEDPNGMLSTYNHNSELSVERGDTVAQGDTIALVGSTGNSTGPHLDLRIRMGGRLVDPLQVY